MSQPPMPNIPPQALSRSHKRIIVCCDGTWQDGVVVSQRWKYTNILRLARAINHVDDRSEPAIHQVVFYQSGIGTENIYDEVVDGVTGATLASKVEEAYAFIAHNYRPGDEIFLFGFSRGAYTARMVAMFIGAIGVLDRTEMDHFATIFVAYQKRGKTQDPDEIQRLDEELAPWTGANAPGKKRADAGPGGFSVKVVGVFDTVGSVGMPEELTLRSDKIKSLFGFPDRLLGHHIERAYQALALNEHRADFDCARFEQTDIGRQKGQILRQVRDLRDVRCSRLTHHSTCQCWFTGMSNQLAHKITGFDGLARCIHEGSHCDIGGGYEEHDLSDLTLNWMIANIGDALSFDHNYVISLPRPTARWGTQAPHDSRTGIFALSKEIQRKLPTTTDDVTHEVVHPSVLHQIHLVPELKENIDRNPALVASLLPWEEQVRTHWEAKLTQLPSAKVQAQEHIQSESDSHHHHHDLVHKAADAVKHLKSTIHGERGSSDVHAKYAQGWVGRVAAESSVGKLVEELFK